MNRKPIFFTSDWHIGHTNVIKFSNRPFRDVDHMKEVLVNNYNACIGNGICYFLGDMGFCKSDELKDTINKLKGTKVLVLGNHDKGVNAMYNVGFDIVVYGVTLQIARHRVTLSHCPLPNIQRENTTGMKGISEDEHWHGESKPKSKRFTTPDNGQFHLHGHIHSPNNGRSNKILGRQYDVGVDANNYRPVAIREIESWIIKYNRRNN